MTPTPTALGIDLLAVHTTGLVCYDQVSLICPQNLITALIYSCTYITRVVSKAQLQTANNCEISIRNNYTVAMDCREWWKKNTALWQFWPERRRVSANLWSVQEQQADNPWLCCPAHEDSSKHTHTALNNYTAYLATGERTKGPGIKCWAVVANNDDCFTGIILIRGRQIW